MFTHYIYTYFPPKCHIKINVSSSSWIFCLQFVNIDCIEFDDIISEVIKCICMYPLDLILTDSVYVVHSRAVYWVTLGSAGQYTIACSDSDKCIILGHTSSGLGFKPRPKHGAAGRPLCRASVCFHWLSTPRAWCVLPPIQLRCFSLPPQGGLGVKQGGWLTWC